MLYAATHITRYTYQGPVTQSLTEARLTPRTFPGQKLHSFRLSVVPEPAVIERRLDYFGNDVNSFAVFKTHDQFSVTSTSVVEVFPPSWGPPLSGGPETSGSWPATSWPSISWPTISWEDARYQLAEHQSAQYGNAENLAAYEFVFDSPYAAAEPELAEYARPSFPPGRSLAEAVVELSHRIHTEFRYKPKSTSIDVPLLHVLENRKGVCQDFAHILIGALRSLHLAARYVSGYLRSGVGAEASHAWAAVFIPGSGDGHAGGWLSVDPTNDVIPGEGHVTLAWGRDYGDVTPVKGIALGGGEQAVEVEVRVRPV